MAMDKQFGKGYLGGEEVLVCFINDYINEMVIVDDTVYEAIEEVNASLTYEEFEEVSSKTNNLILLIEGEGRYTICEKNEEYEAGLSLRYKNVNIEVVCDQDDNIYYYHPMTNEKCQELSQVLQGWSEQDEEEQAEWEKLVELVSDDDILEQRIWDNDGGFYEYRDREEK